MGTFAVVIRIVRPSAPFHQGAAFRLKAAVVRAAQDLEFLYSGRGVAQSRHIDRAKYDAGGPPPGDEDDTGGDEYDTGGVAMRRKAALALAIAGLVAAVGVPSAAATTPNGQKGHEGQPGNQGGFHQAGQQGYEGQPGNQGGH